MRIWGGRGEFALVPKINPGNPVPGRGGDDRIHFFKTKKNKRPRQPFTSPSSEMGKAKNQGTRDRN